MKNLKKYSVLSILVLATFLIGVSKTESATLCKFDRDLEFGVIGDDVKCLQKYLNSSGYIITDTGIGSPGRETDQFLEKTEKALIKWQIANKISPAKGFFGSISREKYKKILESSNSGSSASNSGSSITVVGGSEDVLSKILTKEQLSLLNSKNSSTTVKTNTGVTTNTNASNNSNVTASEGVVKSKLKDLVKMIDDAERQIDEYNDDGNDTSRAVTELNHTKDDFYKASIAYFKSDYKNALIYINKAIDNADDAFRAAGGKNLADNTDDLIDRVNKSIDSAESRIDKASDDGDDVDIAEGILKKAIAKIKQAETAYKAKNYEGAKTFAEAADELVDDAVDAIGDDTDDKNSAENDIDDATDAIKKARNEISDADRNGDDVGSAERFLSSAESKMTKAKRSYDNKEYSDASQYAKDAEDLANEAIDSL